MPKKRSDDDGKIVAFSREELALLDDYFKGTNAETAYLLGRYCGLRINEAFGLKWENIGIEFSEGVCYTILATQFNNGASVKDVFLPSVKTHPPFWHPLGLLE